MVKFRNPSRIRARGLSAADFAKAMAREADEFLPKLLKNIQIGIVIELHNGIVMRNPVLTGRSRHSWFLTLTAPSTRLVTAPGKVGQWYKTTGEPVSGIEKDRQVAVLRSVFYSPLGRRVYITNNQPYIQLLENGSSDKAPAGMVELTLMSVATRGIGHLTALAASAAQ